MVSIEGAVVFSFISEYRTKMEINITVIICGIKPYKERLTKKKGMTAHPAEKTRIDWPKPLIYSSSKILVY